MKYILLFSTLLVLCSRREKPIPQLTEKHYVIKQGDNLEIGLEQLGIDERLKSQLLKVAQDGGFPIRRCQINDTLSAIYTEDSLTAVRYHRGPKLDYILKEDGLAMSYKKIECRDELIEGTITSSLYESMVAIGEHPDLIVDYASIFAWEIDFFTETRSGDSFKILLKREYLDTIPIGYEEIDYLYYGGEIGQYTAFRYRTPDGQVGYYSKDGGSLKKLFLKAPLSYARISSYFSRSRFHPILKIRRPHWGVDYVAPRGTPVSAIGDGLVTYAGWKGQYGRLVEIRHVKGYSTRYGHLSRIRKGIRKGRRVKQGQVIGYVGSTGLATGPHLHFEVRYHKKPINPLRMKVPKSPGLKKQYLKGYKAHVDSVLKYIGRLSEPSDSVTHN